MRIYYPLPGLPRNGGIKVCIQHSHLLNNAGYDCRIVIPGNASSPYPSYDKAKFISQNELDVNEDDIFVFNWPPDIAQYLKYSNKFYYFSQGVINTGCPVGPESYLNDRFELITIGNHSRDFYMYGYGKDSKIINNWIDESVFYPDRDKIVTNRVGMIVHRQHYSEEVKEYIENHGFSVHTISGDENAVADQMRTCDYFVACSQGVWNGHDYAEGFPLPGAEAMGCGSLLVTYWNRGCGEYVFDKVNGFVAWENTKEDIVIKLSQLKSNKNKERIRKAASFSIHSRFNSQVILDQIKTALKL